MSETSHRPPDVDRIRAVMAEEAARDEREDVASVTDIDAAGTTCRVYAPSAAPVGTMTFAHGGGFVFGDLDTHDAHMRRLANRTGWAVVAVHYRRAPEHHHPAAMDDMERALTWLVAEGPAYGLPTDRIAPIGDSAGAKLALSLALRHPGTFTALVLVYPFVDPRLRYVATDTAERRAAVASARWYWDRYIGDHDPSDPEVSPIDSPDLGTLPPTLVVTAGLDYLCPENEELARRIAAAGGDATIDHHPDVAHGFWRKAALHPESEASLAVIDRFLADADADAGGR